VTADENRLVSEGDSPGREPVLSPEATRLGESQVEGPAEAGGANPIPGEAVSEEQGTEVEGRQRVGPVAPGASPAAGGRQVSEDSSAGQETTLSSDAPVREPAERPRPAARAPAGPPPGQVEPPTEDALKLQAIFKDLLGEEVLKVEHNFGELVLTVAPESVVEICRLARAEPRLKFDYLRCISAVDYVTNFELVYHLYSMDERHKMTLKTQISHDEPEIESVISIWSGADWHERELAEMFGINVKGHPNLEPLLLEEGLDEHPLLKSHPLVPIGEDRPGVVTGPSSTEPFGVILT